MEEYTIPYYINIKLFIIIFYMFEGNRLSSVSLLIESKIL